MINDVDESDYVVHGGRMTDGLLHEGNSGGTIILRFQVDQEGLEVRPLLCHFSLLHLQESD